MLTRQVLKSWGLLAVLAVGCDSRSASGSAHLRRGDALLAESKLQKAIVEYEGALKTSARPDALLRLAGLYESTGEFAKAEKDLREASQKLPNDVNLRLAHARVLAATGRTREAFDEVRHVVQTSPGQAEPLALSAVLASTPAEAKQVKDKLLSWHELQTRRGNAGNAGAETFLPLANLHETLGEPELARKARSEAARSGVKNLQIALNLANCYFSMERLGPAEELFSLAAKHTPTRSATWLRLGAVRVALRDFQGANAAISQLDKRMRADPETTLLEARIRLGLGTPAQAQAMLEALLKSPHDNDSRRSLARAHFWLGHTRLAQSDPRAAEHAWLEALQVDSGYEPAELALAELYLSQAQPAKAVSHLQHLAARAPRDTAALRMLGRALLEDGNPQAAAQAFERYSELKPEDAEGPYLAANALAIQGEVTEACARLETSLALAPGRFESLQALVLLMARQREFDDAENRLQIELAQRGRSAPLLTLLGNVLFEERDDAPPKVAEAERVYREAIATDGAYTAAWLGLGRLYTQTERAGAALLVYQAGVAHANAPEELWLQIGQLHTRNRDGNEAKNAYEQVLARKADSVAALNNLAYVYAELLDRPEAGLAFAERARRLAPNAANVADTYGWLLWQHDQPDRALPLLEDAASRLPGSAEAQYHLGLALVRVGKKEAGRAALTRALNLSPTFAGANEARVALAAE